MSKRPSIGIEVHIPLKLLKMVSWIGLGIYFEEVVEPFLNRIDLEKFCDVQTRTYGKLVNTERSEGLFVE